jgi:hypothetical protein
MDLEVEFNVLGQPGTLDAEDRYHGHDGFMRYWATIDEAWESNPGEPREAVDFGDRSSSSATVALAEEPAASTGTRPRYPRDVEQGDGGSRRLLLVPGRSPRSRRAVGVGDFAGGHGGRANPLRDVERGGRGRLWCVRSARPSARDVSSRQRSRRQVRRKTRPSARVPARL